jgi:hypothetical protein
VSVSTVKTLVDDLASGKVTIDEFLSKLDSEIEKDKPATADVTKVPASIQRANAGLRRLQRL